MTTMRCPICKRPLPGEEPPSEGSPPKATNPSFPFCSPRCKLIDLGAWLDGKYRIVGEPLDSDHEGGDRDMTETAAAADRRGPAT